MATHSKRVDPKAVGLMQVFSNDTSLSDAYTFAADDYIDFTASLGRPAAKVIIIVRGTFDITFSINPIVKAKIYNRSGADTDVDIDGVSGINQLRLSSSSGSETFEFPEGYPIDMIKITALTGTASSSNNVTIIGF